MKRIVFLIILLALMAPSGALAIDPNLLKAGAAVAGSIAGSNSNKSKKVDASNSKFKNKVQTKQSLTAGNNGIELKGENINAKNADFDNDVKVKQSLTLGNNGISVGN